MVEPYTLPHECEREGLARLLSGLDARQRKVLRSYVWLVELGERTVSEWLAGEKAPISRSMWYDAGPKGRYWGNGAFRDAVAAYVRAGLEWQTNQDRRAVEAAQRKIRRAAPAAADRLVDQVAADIGEFFKVDEKWMRELLPTYEVLKTRTTYEDGTRIVDEKGEPVTEYLVRAVVLDLDKLKDPRYSKWVREFTDSPKNGLGLKLHDPVRAASDLLDRADVETASKSETRVEGEVGLDDATLDRLDQALMQALFTGPTPAGEGDSAGN